MRDNIFLDSNLLIYYSTDAIKSVVVKSLIEDNDGAFGSTQTLNEFANVCFRRGLLDSAKIPGAIEQFSNLLTIEQLTLQTTLDALRLKSRYGFQFYDCLILATALAADCTILYSEDLQHGQRIDGTLTILNPFAT